MNSLDLARHAIACIRNQVSTKSLGWTTYCAMVIKLNTGNRAVLVAEAGASATGINGPLIDHLTEQLSTAVIGCAYPTPGDGTWHMNDAEQQALSVWDDGYRHQYRATIEAVVATRNICPSCTHTLTQLGLQVNRDEAS